MLKTYINEWIQSKEKQTSTLAMMWLIEANAVPS